MKRVELRLWGTRLSRLQGLGKVAFRIARLLASRERSGGASRSRLVALGLLALSIVLFPPSGSAQTDTEVFKVTSPIQTLEKQIGANIDDKSEPYNSGVMDPSQAATMLKALGADDTKTTIIHLLRWKDPEHTQVKFQKWYLYDPSPSKTSFYLKSKQQLFESVAIPGRKNFQFVYIHLNADLSQGENEWKVVAAAGTSLKHPVSYTITVTKQDTQFLQDLKTVLQIVGLARAAAAATQPGYYSVTTFDSQWETSSISIAASLDSGNKSQGKAEKENGTANQLAAKTYTNEKPSWIGLSAGVPITKYKDVTFDSSSGTIIPSSITKQDVYLFVDGYVPPVLPSLSSFRYVPHPFFGLPIKGKVLRHSMLGAGVGLRWFEPFGGIIFDTENNEVKGPATHKTELKIRPVFGLKISISAVAKALKTK